MKPVNRGVRWAVLFPFHGKAGSQRISTVKASWLSLTRAIKEARTLHSAWTFEIMLLDDSDGAWTPTADSGLADIWRCAGNCTEPGKIATHTMRGYRWAAIERRADMITNIEGDDLLRFKQTHITRIPAIIPTPIAMRPAAGEGLLLSSKP